MKYLLLAILVAPGVASATIINIEYWGTVWFVNSGGTRAGESVHGRLEINTALAPPGEVVRGGGMRYTNHGDNSGFITDPDYGWCGCSQDFLSLVDRAPPNASDVFVVINEEWRSPAAHIRQRLNVPTADILSGVSLDQNLSFDKAPRTTGFLSVEKMLHGVRESFEAVIDRIRVSTSPAPGSCGI
jgi:hypothetical protein